MNREPGRTWKARAIQAGVSYKAVAERAGITPNRFYLIANRFIQGRQGEINLIELALKSLEGERTLTGGSP